MAKPSVSKLDRRERPPLLTALLLTVVVVETCLAVWGFVHIGNGSNPAVSLPRYGYGAAELLTIIGASTASFAWLTFKWKRYGAQGLFVCLGLSLLWNILWGYPPESAAKELSGQSTFVTITMVFTVVAGLGLWMLLARFWPKLERS